MTFMFFRNIFSRPARIEEKLDRMEIHMSRVTQTLIAINDQLNKAAEEIVSRISELQTRDYLTEEDMAILSRIKDGAQTLDDIVPDEVVEEAEAEEEQESEGTETPEEDESGDVDEETPEDESPFDEDETDEEEVNQANA